MTPQAKAHILFASAISLLGLCAIFTYFSFSTFRKSEQLVSHTQEVRATVGDLEALLNSAARARMTYLMSGDENALAEYHSILPQVPERLQHLRELVHDNPGQLSRCDRLEAFTKRRMEIWDSTISQKARGESLDPAALMSQNLTLSSEGSAITSAIRDEELHLLRLRSPIAPRTFFRSQVLLLFTFALALLFLFLYYRFLNVELRSRTSAEKTAHEAYSRELVLRQEEQRFRLFIDAVKDYAIFTLDAEGRVSSWNEGAKRLKGYETAEILGKHFSIFFPQEDVEAGKPKRELEVASKEGRVEDEGWRVRKDGGRFWADVVITAIRDSTGRLIGFVKVTRDFTDRMQAKEKLRQANAELIAEAAERQSAEERLALSEKSLRDLSLHLLRTQDEERRRIGRDLHDSLGQYLAVLKMNLDSLASSVGSQNGSPQLVEQCVKLAQDAIRELRTISYLLYPPMLEELGLKSAIPWYLDGFSKRSNIETTFEANPEFGRLDAQVELALFRILQEALTNVHRHSESKTASVYLRMENDTAVLEVVDQGKGFSPELSELLGKDWVGSLGVGLRGMNERMRQLGGRLEVKSGINGTIVTANVPARGLASMRESA